MSSAHMSILKRHGSDSSIIYPHCIGEYPLYMRDALLAFKMSDASTTLCIQKRTQRENSLWDWHHLQPSKYCSSVQNQKDTQLLNWVCLQEGERKGLCVLFDFKEQSKFLHRYRSAFLAPFWPWSRLGNSGKAMPRNKNKRHVYVVSVRKP